MEHLELHCITCRTEIEAMINQIDMNRRTTEAQLQMITEQQTEINNFFESQRKTLEERRKTFEKICRQLSSENNCFIFTSKYKEIAKDLETIKIETESFSTKLIDSFSQICQTQRLKLFKRSETGQELRSYETRSPIIFDMRILDESNSIRCSFD